ncbi:BZ3500_MvSof-1268-A1-R1_Chr2-1g04386 [Microbotryum saponariae]|uniref:BZ3500_MvSof-1268-A1-R1_Chr2-1g04386 protein n=1 Tax=Microbotryum saponariae TaxID=289078 RepID=A0A2X0KQJ0_9BASI|nr:BZ3500_MvSof-1268-A1-R1_Chr2-1g04386 [Microbotryum saponariae]SCZ91600.1 BZ3501_MvSof-1269-A2-R1_Chr2-1g04042 [Microbotryum saponariae]
MRLDYYNRRVARVPVTSVLSARTCNCNPMIPQLASGSDFGSFSAAKSDQGFRPMGLRSRRVAVDGRPQTRSATRNTSKTSYAKPEHKQQSFEHYPILTPISEASIELDEPLLADPRAARQVQWRLLIWVSRLGAYEFSARYQSDNRPSCRPIRSRSLEATETHEDRQDSSELRKKAKVILGESLDKDSTARPVQIEAIAALFELEQFGNRDRYDAVTTGSGKSVLFEAMHLIYVRGAVTIVGKNVIVVSEETWRDGELYRQLDDPNHKIPFILIVYAG